MTDRSVRRDSSAALLSIVLLITLATAGCGQVGVMPAGPPLSPTPGATAAGAPTPQPAATATAQAPATGQVQASAQPLAPAALPGWSADDLAGLAAALDSQCAAPRQPAQWSGLCPEFRANHGRLRAWIEARFVAQPITDAHGDANGLVTGYYEPELSGSRTRSGPGQAPLYRRPTDEQLRARPTRADIEGSNRLAGSEIAWVDDPVEAFFLQVQGSGRIRLREGGVMRVGYAGDNGHPYRAIGATLIERGALTAAESNAATIKAWLRANPAQAAAVMQSNPRYIFFHELAPTKVPAGPPGSLGVPLTPLRSIAIDPQRIPPGALIWLDTTHPLDGRALRRLVLAQDTGAAIIGAVRADLFWGSGREAEQAAGLMKQRARLWLLQAPGRPR